MTEAYKPTKDIEKLKAGGLTDTQIGNLIALKKRYEKGDFSEETDESKHLLYGKWLYDHEKISDDLQAEDKPKYFISPIKPGEGLNEVLEKAEAALSFVEPTKSSSFNNPDNNSYYDPGTGDL